jgi:hypothetical protein
MAQKNIMSNLLKSKIVLGFMVLAIVFGAVAFATPTKASCDLGSVTLKQGMRSEAVTCLQTSLGMTTVTGYFGTMTKAAVMAFQTNHGLTADGLVGAMTKAAITGSTVGVYPAGCSSFAGYSATTGLPCTGALTYPVGCTSAVGYSPTTGQACNGVVTPTTLPAGCTSTAGYSPTTGQACSGTIVNSSGEGSVTLDYTAIPAAGVVINKGQADQNAAGITIKAVGSDMKISHVWLDFTGYRPWLAADTATLKDGSAILATIPLSASTMSEVTAGTKWQLQFNGLNVTVPVGTTKTLMFTLGRPTLTNTYGTLTIATTSNVRATDMAGFSNTYTMAARTISLPVTAASAGTITNTISATSPLAQSVSGFSTTAGDYTPVKLLDFDLKAKDGPINITDISGTFTNAGTCADTSSTSECIASAELRDGTNVLSSVTGANVFDFSSLNIDIATGATKTLSVWVQARDVNTGAVIENDRLYATVNSITATSGPDYASASCTSTCTVVGATQHFFVYAPTITLGTTTATTSNSSGSISADFAIPFTVTAPSDHAIYVHKTLAASGSNNVEVVITGSIGGTLSLATPMTASTLASGTEGTTYFLVPAGTSRTFTAYSHLPVGGGAGYEGVKITKIYWALDDSATGAQGQDWGLGDFHTASVYVTAS